MPDDDEIERETEDIRLKIAHAHAALYDRVRLEREARRQYARDYYAAHREEQLEYQRQRRDAQREEDPDGYRKRAKERTKRWRDKHVGEVNAKLRAKYQANPEKLRARRREYYAEHAEELRGKRREHYAKAKEARDAARRAWLEDEETRRRDVGLPPARLPQTERDQREAHAAAADRFFVRKWTEAELREALKSITTPPDVWAAWVRDCARARATYHLAEQKAELERLQKELGRARPGPKPKPRPTAEQRAEDARLDAIGKQINDRLRHREPPRRPHHLDPAAPHPMLQPNHTMGMNR
ncbi:hypothetical protein [Microbacterium sp.]|uniref:hypothetical protein n=1 Tax=Microbacterium sp. TaxID=51671 RepID=UPI0025F5EC71|nr:hypothetical protein [Microbacterium sp.]